MGTRHPNPRRARTHKSYSVEEVTRLCGVHKNTVRRWQAEGLAAIDKKRPTLFEGQALRDFLQAQRDDAKRPCPPGHFYCLRCRDHRLPWEGLVDCEPVGEKVGKLKAICPTCEKTMFQRVNLARWESRKARGPFRQAEARIGDTGKPSLNGDSKPIGEA